MIVIATINLYWYYDDGDDGGWLTLNDYGFNFCSYEDALTNKRNKRAINLVIGRNDKKCINSFQNCGRKMIVVMLVTLTMTIKSSNDLKDNLCSNWLWS